MAYFRICPKCGCNLDPGEQCDCEQEKTRKINDMQNLFRTGKNGQMTLCLMKEERAVEKAVV